MARTPVKTVKAIMRWFSESGVNGPRSWTVAQSATDVMETISAVMIRAPARSAAHTTNG
jgi:hypothetical protein